MLFNKTDNVGNIVYKKKLSLNLDTTSEFTELALRHTGCYISNCVYVLR